MGILIQSSFNSSYRIPSWLISYQFIIIKTYFKEKFFKIKIYFCCNNHTRFFSIIIQTYGFTLLTLRNNHLYIGDNAEKEFRRQWFPHFQLGHCSGSDCYDNWIDIVIDTRNFTRTHEVLYHHIIWYYFILIHCNNTGINLFSLQHWLRQASTRKFISTSLSRFTNILGFERINLFFNRNLFKYWISQWSYSYCLALFGWKFINSIYLHQISFCIDYRMSEVSY